MREFRRVVSLDGKGSDLVAERSRSIFASEEPEPSKWAWKGDDALSKPSSSGARDDLSFKFDDQLTKPGDEFTWKYDDRLTKPGDEFSWKYDDRLRKPEDDFTWKGSDRLAKPEGLVKPVPASPGGNSFEGWPAKGSSPVSESGTGTVQVSKQEAIGKSEMMSRPFTGTFNEPQQMQAENRQFTMVSNIMKTKHDTAKNAINNVR